MPEKGRWHASGLCTIHDIDPGLPVTIRQPVAAWPIAPSRHSVARIDVSKPFTAPSRSHPMQNCERPRPPAGSLSVFRDLLLLAGVAVLVMAVPVLLDRTLYNIDQETHFRWINQFFLSLEKGEPYPRWMFLANGGLGELHYGAYLLYWYLVAALMKLGLNTWAALRLLALCATWASASMVYLVCGRLFSRRAGLATGALVAATPFSLFLFTHYAAFPWHFTLSFAVCFLLLSLNTANTPARLILLALCAAAITLSHTLVAFMSLICAAPAVLYMQSGKPAARLTGFLTCWALPVLCGVGMAAFHLIPAIAARGLLADASSDPLYFNWKNSFAFPTFSARENGMRWFAIQWIYASQILLCALVALFALAKSRSTAPHLRRFMGGVLVFAFVALAMSSELAYPLYQHIGTLNNLQWPYRFLSVAGLATAIALGLASTLDFDGRLRVVLRVAVVLAIALSVALCGVVAFQAFKEGRPSVMGPQLLQGDFKQYGLELKTQGKGAEIYRRNGGLTGYCAGIPAECKETRDTVHEREWEVRASRPFQLLLPLFHFPGWETFLDDQPALHALDTDSGLIVMAVPAGTHRIRIVFKGLPEEETGRRIALGAFALLAILCILSSVGRRRASSPEAA